MERKIMRGEIYIADLDPVVGSEQGENALCWLYRITKATDIVPLL